MTGVKRPWVVVVLNDNNNDYRCVMYILEIVTFSLFKGIDSLYLTNSVQKMTEQPIVIEYDWKMARELCMRLHLFGIHSFIRPFNKNDPDLPNWSSKRTAPALNLNTLKTHDVIDETPLRKKRPPRLCFNIRKDRRYLTRYSYKWLSYSFKKLEPIYNHNTKELSSEMLATLYHFEEMTLSCPNPLDMKDWLSEANMIKLKNLEKAKNWMRRLGPFKTSYKVMNYNDKRLPDVEEVESISQLLCDSDKLLGKRNGVDDFTQNAPDNHYDHVRRLKFCQHKIRFFKTDLLRYVLLCSI